MNIRMCAMYLQILHAHVCVYSFECIRRLTVSLLALFCTIIIIVCWHCLYNYYNSMLALVTDLRSGDKLYNVVGRSDNKILKHLA